MPNYSIPKEFLDGFEIIQSLPEETISNISVSLKAIKIGGRRNAIIDALKTCISDTDSVEIVAFSVFSMGRLISRDNADLEAISNGLANAFFYQKNIEDLSGEKTNELSKRILQISTSWISAKKTFKALQLWGNSERLCRQANIVSDVRLIFDDEIASKNRQGLILHQLKLDYLVNDNEAKEFYITLDNNNLHKLKEQINRAIEKEQKIKEDYSEIDFISLED